MKNAQHMFVGSMVRLKDQKNSDQGFNAPAKLGGLEAALIQGCHQNC